MLDVKVPSGSSAVIVSHGEAGEAVRAWKAAQAGHVDEVDEAGLKALPEASVDAVVLSTASGQTDVEALATAAARVLRAGAPLLMVGPQGERDQLSLAAMMAGLVEHSSATEGESVHVRADKPGFTAGASAPLPAASTAAAGAKVWKLMADDGDDVELEDEDALLETDIVAPRPKAEACAPTRKPCANCSCGRADTEASQRKQAAVASASSGSSGCGSCGKGDAFRCASCPYLGAPPFKAGEAPMLDTDVQDV